MEPHKSYDALKERLGEDLLRDRLLRQANHWARMTHQGEGIFRLEKYVSIDSLAEFCLKLVLLWPRAHGNIFRIETNVIEWHFPRLPQSFDGFRLLQLSDLHLDVDDDLAACITAMVIETPHDALVITGDYRNSTDKDYNPSMKAVRSIIESSTAPKYGILGNHDFIEMVWHLEEAGLPVLLNESVEVKRDAGSIWIAGVDDPHFYRTADFARASSAVPGDSFCILLCHSPEVHAEAAGHDFDLMLSGHTHGGQICLPGGRHVVCPVKHLPREFIKGKWRSGRMHGYTSKGTGSSGVAARLNCLPEVTVHVLRKA